MVKMCFAADKIKAALRPHSWIIESEVRFITATTDDQYEPLVAQWDAFSDGNYVLKPKGKVKMNFAK